MYCADTICRNEKAKKKLDLIYRQTIKKMIGFKKQERFDRLIPILLLPDLEQIQ